MIIDADAHVEESQAMFDRLDKEFHDRRPLPVRFDGDTVFGKYNAVWLIEGETYPKLVGKGGTIFRTPTLMEAASLKRESIGAQEMTDIDARLKDMDKVKIDTQVVFPSLFLTTTAEDLRLEAALLRAYNSFLGECSAASKGRIRFAALVPIRDVDASIKEIKRAAKIGAAAVMLHGMAWDKLLGDESLFPFYEEAANLNLPICVHLGWGCPAMTDIFDASTNFYSAILPVTIGFHSILTSAAFERIPNLRFGFLGSRLRLGALSCSTSEKGQRAAQKSQGPDRVLQGRPGLRHLRSGRGHQRCRRGDWRGFVCARLRLSPRRSFASGRYGGGVPRKKRSLAAHGRENAVG